MTTKSAMFAKKKLISISYVTYYIMDIIKLNCSVGHVIHFQCSIIRDFNIRLCFEEILMCIFEVQLFLHSH